MVVDNSKPVTVVIATDSAAPSGVGEHMLSLATGLRNSHYVVVGFPSQGSGPAFLRRAQDAGIAAKAIENDGASLSPWLIDISADILHVHAGIAWEGHALTNAGWRAGVPVIRTEHLPYLLTDKRQQQDHLVSIGLLEHTIFVSEATSESFRRVGATAGRCTTIQNGIAWPQPSSPRTQIRAALEIPESDLVLLTVGRFTPQKGYPHLLKAAQKILRAKRDVRILLVGDGPDRESTQKMAADLGIGAFVDFLGERADVPDLLAAADLFVLASLFEGLPLVVLEAMAMGLPVVASRIGGVCEALGPDYPWLFDVADEDALAATIAGALGDKTMRQSLGDQNRRRFSSRFTAERMAAETAALYGAVVSERASLP
ncbi:MAG TPA: glycosyltransferase family 4 protein [Rhizobiaceae bacterium]|nr:glycosyltransferase family 4 protein [Rhizobiaceae bacterium]